MSALLLLAPAAVRPQTPPTAPATSATAPHSTWEPPIQLTSGWGDKWFYALAAGPTTVHFAYATHSILYRRSTDDGKTWTRDVALGSGRIYLEAPFVAHGSQVYLVFFRNLRRVRDWCCPRDVGDMFVRVSTDDGTTWQPESPLTTSRSAFRLAMATSGATVHVVWSDFRSGIWDLYYRRSTNSGATWEPEVKLVAGMSKIGSTVGTGRPSIAILGQSVHVAWMDARDGAPPCDGMPECTEVYYKRSNDNGTTWSPDARLTKSARFSGRPSIGALSPGTVAVVMDRRDPDGKAENVHVMISTDNGTSWGESRPLSSLTAGTASHNTILTHGSAIHVAWFDERHGKSDTEVFYRASSDAGIGWAPEENLSQGPGSSFTPLLAATRSFLHVVWADKRTGNLQVFYRRRPVP